MKLIYRSYLETLENPTSQSNKNMIKFILHLHKKKLFKIGVIIKLIEDSSNTKLRAKNFPKILTDNEEKKQGVEIKF